MEATEQEKGDNINVERSRLEWETCYAIQYIGTIICFISFICLFHCLLIPLLLCLLAACCSLFSMYDHVGDGDSDEG